MANRRRYRFAGGDASGPDYPSLGATVAKWRARARGMDHTHQILTKFSRAYCGEAARHFWGVGGALPRHFCNSATQSRATNKQIDASKQTIGAALADLMCVCLLVVISSLCFFK